MKVEISGTVIQVMPQESGQGKNGQWFKQDFVVDLDPEGQYDDHLCVTMFNNKIQQLAPGDQITGSVGVRSNQGKGSHAGRWFTNVNAIYIEKVANEAPQPVPSAAIADEDDGLPF